MEKSTASKIHEGLPNTTPVKVESLRRHFKNTYKLADEQIDLMLESSARSLRATFAAMEDAFLDQDFYEKVARHAHSMKGLLLNMGEKEWAERAREIEVAALDRKNMDFRQMIGEIHQGMLEVLDF